MVKIVKTSLAVFLTGLVVKLMDDYLDQEIDRLNERYSLAVKLKRKILPYSLLLFSFALLCDYKLSISLLWASYIVGMGVDVKSSWGLKVYQELSLLLVMGFFLLDRRQFLFALLIILFIQTVDDYIDYYREKYISKDNFINYLGRLGTLFIIGVSLICSLIFDWQLSLVVVFCTFLINLLI
ncbi:MAG: hypothetical protein R6V17_08480 [Halanaerobacter sp.]